MVTPHRIALARPSFRQSFDEAKGGTAQLVLLCDLFERTLAHPSLAVMAPTELGALATETGFSPRQTSGPEVAAHFFALDRRDEVLWLELDLGGDGGDIGASPRVVLHAISVSGTDETFVAIGERGACSELIDRALALWLETRGLDALPAREGYATADLRGVVDQLDPLLVVKAKTLIAPSEPDPAPDAEAAGDAAATSADEDEPKPTEPATEKEPELWLGLDLDEAPRAVRIAALRALEVCTGAALDVPILEFAPDDLGAQIDSVARLGSKSQEAVPIGLVRQLLAKAPNSPRLLRLLAVSPAAFGPDGDALAPSCLERLGAAGLALFVSPRNLQHRGEFARRLGALGQAEQRVRVHERTRDDDFFRPSAWLPLLSALPGLERPGEWKQIAGWAANTVGLVVNGVPRPWNPSSMQVDVHASRALLGVGLLGEAIVLLANRLEGLESRYPREAEQLKGWRKQARYVAWGFSREGYYRGEDARVLEGFSRAEPENGIDLAMLMESLVACGRTDQALLAWAHLGHGRLLASPASTIAAVRVLLAAGRHRDGFELRLRHLLANPARLDDHLLDRHGALLRAATLAGAGGLESVIESYLAAGASTLAAAASREIADFVGGAAQSEVVRAALDLRDELEFDLSWLAGFEAVPGKSAIDQMFIDACEPSADAAAEAVRADRLLERWPNARFAKIEQADETGLCRATAYLFAQAMARYLAMTTARPSLVAGALRTVAGEALMWLRTHRAALGQDDLRAILSAFEPAASAANAVSVDLVDRWLLRVEAALRLEERTHGRMNLLTSALPAVAALLRGPETVAIELRAACVADPSRRAWLLARATRALGASAAVEWAESAAGLDASDNDVAATAAFLCVGRDAGPSVLSAAALFGEGKAELAYETLCRGLADASSEAWRDDQLAALGPLWANSALEIPFDFGEGAPAAVECLQRGDAIGATKILRWLAAIDPNNGELHRNLGIAYAMQGEVELALTHFARASADQDTQFAAGTLFQAGHPSLSMAVLDYASQWYTRAEQWLTFGAIAFQVMDNPRTAIAYAAAWELDPDAYDASNLNSWAGVLDEIGDYDRCESIAKRLIAVSEHEGEQAQMWASNGWHHLACAYIGQGRREDALEVAAKAIEMNTLPDNQAVFAQTLERARTGARPPVPPDLPPPVPLHPAYLALAGGDIKATVATFAGSGDFEGRLAHLRAARFRYGSDNYTEVTAGAREVAERLIADSTAFSEPIAQVARSFALEVREQALFAIDPMPTLGDRGSREAFYKEFRDRGGIIVGEPPIEEVEFVDREVCPGTLAPRASDYIELLLELAAVPLSQALSDRGLAGDDFVTLAEAWGKALRLDPGLAEILSAGLRQAARA